MHDLTSRRYSTASATSIGSFAVRDGLPFEGMTLRLFDPSTAEWWIHSGRYRPGANLVAAHDWPIHRRCRRVPWRRNSGWKKVRCRFLWTRPTCESARWEQALSDDGGKTWETNWIMSFTRQ